MPRDRSRSDTLRNREYDTLTRDQQQAVDSIIDTAKRQGGTASRMIGQTEYYAYPHPGGGMAWGLNVGPTGMNSKRGVTR